MLSSRLERDKSLKAAANYDDTPGYTRVSGRFNFSISPPPIPPRIAYARCVAACSSPRVLCLCPFTCMRLRLLV